MCVGRCIQFDGLNFFLFFFKSVNNGSARFKLIDGPIILQKFNNSLDLIEILIEIAETIFFN